MPERLLARDSTDINYLRSSPKSGQESAALTRIFSERSPDNLVRAAVFGVARTGLSGLLQKTRDSLTGPFARGIRCGK